MAIDTIATFKYAHLIMCTIGCTANILLIYAILTKTPKTIKTYSILVLNIAFSDLSLCLVDFFVQQRIIPAGMSLAFISTGFCSYIGPKACFLGYSVMLHFYTHSQWLLLLSFCYRYWILNHSAPRRTALQLIVFMFYLPSFFQMVMFFRSDSDPLEVRAVIKSYFPEYNTTGLTVTGVLDITEFGTLFAIIHLVSVSIPILTTVLILRRQIVKKLIYNGLEVKQNTKNLQTQLLQALTFQALIPVFYFLSIGAYLTGQLGIYNHPALEYFVFTSSLFAPLLTPCSSFYFITPYRRFIVSIVRRSRITYNTSMPAASVSATGKTLHTVGTTVGKRMSNISAEKKDVIH